MLHRGGGVRACWGLRAVGSGGCGKPAFSKSKRSSLDGLQSPLQMTTNLGSHARDSLNQSLGRGDVQLLSRDGV